MNSNRKWTKLVICLLAVVTIAVVWRQLGEVLSLGYLSEQEGALRTSQSRFPVLVAGIALILYVGVTGLSIPGATVLTLVYGWFFGFWQGLLIVSFGSTAGATLALLLSRYLVRDWVQRRFGHRLASVNDAFERDGALYLFTLRLIPVVPFFVINAVMGLTMIRATTFWWVSQIGMLPGSVAYVFAGTTVPSLNTLADKGVQGIVSWQLLLAFAILGLLPLVIKRTIALVMKTRRIE